MLQLPDSRGGFFLLVRGKKDPQEAVLIPFDQVSKLVSQFRLSPICRASAPGYFFFYFLNLNHEKFLRYRQ